jgi:hypothetical protein
MKTSELEQINKGIYNKIQNDWPEWKTGFKLYYSPVKENPDLMILSFQPGGGEESYKAEDKKNFDSGDFSLLKENIYTQNNFRFSKKIRELFSRYHENLNTVPALTLIPFRAKSIDEWNKNKYKQEMEEYTMREIFPKLIRIIKPKNILIVGFATLDKIKRNYNIENEEVMLKREKGSAKLVANSVLKFEGADIRLITTIHLTGARPTKNEMENMSNYLMISMRLYEELTFT